MSFAVVRNKAHAASFPVTAQHAVLNYGIIRILLFYFALFFTQLPSRLFMADSHPLPESPTLHNGD